MLKAIEVKNLNFSYGKTKVINNLSFEVNYGDFVCIMGANGSGKSTLLKLMLGILIPDSGKIKINIKNKISYVSQRALCFNKSFPATVEEIVSLGSRRLFLFGKSSKREVIEALDKVDMRKHIKDKIGSLSGGQQQRAILAKALISNPRYIFLDEPTNGIDNSTAKSICCSLADINKKYKITVIMVTHDIFSIINHATKIIDFCDNGEIRISRKFDPKIFYHDSTLSQI